MKRLAAFLALGVVLGVFPRTALANGSISGATEVGFGGGISGITVIAWDGGTVYRSAVSSGGLFTIADVPPGSYFVYTANASGYINKAYPNLTCAGCDVVTTGTRVSVSDNVETQGINFNFLTGSRISGRVWGAGTCCLEGVDIEVYNSSARLVARAVSGSDGGYLSDAGLPAGTYYARTRSKRWMLLDVAYGGFVCYGDTTCAITSTTGIAVTSPQSPPTNIDFDLHTNGGRIRGRVTDFPSSTRSIGDDFNDGVLATRWMDHSAAGTQALETGGRLQLRNYDGGIRAAAVTSNCQAVGNFDAQLDYTLTNWPEDNGNILTFLATDLVPYIGDGPGISIIEMPVGSGDDVIQFHNVSIARNGFTGRLRLRRVNDILTGSIWNGTGWTDLASIDVPSSQGRTSFTLRLGDPGYGAGVDAATVAIDNFTVTGSTTCGIGSVGVDVYSSSSSLIGRVYTDQTGSYTTFTLPTADFFGFGYLMRTSNRQGWIDVAYAQKTCIDCVPSDYPGPRDDNLIPLAYVSDVATIDFRLSRGATFTGTVRNAATGAGIPGISVELYQEDAPSTVFLSATTDAAGSYRTPALPEGWYYVRTRNALGYEDQMRPGMRCAAGCDLTDSWSTYGSSAFDEENNFDLRPAGDVRGTVRRASNNAALFDVPVILRSGTEQFVAYTNVLGGFTASQIPIGTYVAKTNQFSNLKNQLYDGLPCDLCPLTSGTPIVVTQGANIQNVNFSLAAGGQIGGTVTSASTGLGIQGVTVLIYNSSNVQVAFATTGPTGAYTTTALSSGSYYAVTRATAPYGNKVYPNIDCAGCNPALAGTPITVTTTVTSGINFSLGSGVGITGVVTASSGGATLSGVQINIYNASAVLVGTVSTGASGVYQSGPLPTGQYYVLTDNVSGYIDEAYNDIPCVDDCDPLLSQAVSVTAGVVTANINFALTLGGRISGSVTNEVTGAALSGVTVRIYNQAGAPVSHAITGTTGGYVTSGLPAGTYRASTSNALGYIEELYDSLPCYGCAISSGSPIDVAVGALVSNTNFSLVLGGRVSGRVTSSVTGLGIPNVDVRLFSEIGHVTILTDSDGVYTTPAVPAGTYREIAAASAGYDRLLYNDIPCAACDWSTGHPISVAVRAVTGDIDFVLRPLTPTITLSASDFQGGGTVTATIGNAQSLRYDFVGFYPVANTNTGFTEWKYLNGLQTAPATGLTTAQVTFSVPSAPGQYNVRLVRQEGDVLTALTSSGNITVTSQPSVTLSHTTIPGGGTVIATVANGPGVRYDYLGFYPVGNGPTGWLEFKYLNGQQTAPAAGLTSASVSFTTPTAAGDYNVRLIGAGETLIATSATLTVTAPSTITVSATTVAWGGSIKASVANSPGGRYDWVGLYPIANGATGFVTWQYLSGSQIVPPEVGMTAANDLEFAGIALFTSGQYHVRLYSAAGNLLATSATFTVKPSPSVTATPASVSAGATFNATVANGLGGRYDWVGLFPSGNSDTGFVNWWYLSGTQVAPAVAVNDATFPVTAPAIPGQYQLRFFNGSGTWVASSTLITVTNPPVVGVSATAAVSGSAVTASMSYGPNTRFSWVGLFPIANGNTGFVEWKYLNGTQTAPANAMTGNADVLFTMPATAGQYHVRFFNNLSILIATSPTITVTAPAIALSSSSVAVGATVTATVSGLPASRYNWCGLFPIGNGNTGYLYEKYLNDLQTPPATALSGGTVSFTMPLTPGQYNIRCFRPDGTPIIGPIITVSAAPSLGVGSTTVTAGSTLTVIAAGGPGARWDWVGLFPVNNGNTGFMTFRYLSGTQTAPAVGMTGGAINFTMPTTPGQYNFRFFYTYSGTPIVTSVTVTVVP